MNGAVSFELICRYKEKDKRILIPLTISDYCIYNKNFDAHNLLIEQHKERLLYKPDYYYDDNINIEKEEQYDSEYDSDEEKEEDNEEKEEEEYDNSILIYFKSIYKSHPDIHKKYKNESIGLENALIRAKRSGISRESKKDIIFNNAIQIKKSFIFFSKIIFVVCFRFLFP